MGPNNVALTSEIRPGELIAGQMGRETNWVFISPLVKLQKNSKMFLVPPFGCVKFQDTKSLIGALWDFCIFYLHLIDDIFYSFSHNF